MVKTHNFLNFKGQNKRFLGCYYNYFWVAIITIFGIGINQIEHEESDYRDPETQGSMLSDPRQINSKQRKKYLSLKDRSFCL